jgi:hypothetical protein
MGAGYERCEGLIDFVDDARRQLWWQHKGLDVSGGSVPFCLTEG